MLFSPCSSLQERDLARAAISELLFNWLRDQKHEHTHTRCRINTIPYLSTVICTSTHSITKHTQWLQCNHYLIFSCMCVCVRLWLCLPCASSMCLCESQCSVLSIIVFSSRITPPFLIISNDEVMVARPLENTLQILIQDQLFQHDLISLTIPSS